MKHTEVTMSKNLIPLKNQKYLGYECVICFKNIDEDERQMIISLGVVQTWCVLCMIIKYPNDKLLLDFANRKDDLILIRNKFYEQGNDAR
jgi:hypothetical protein